MNSAPRRNSTNVKRRPSQAREPLTTTQIIELDRALTAAFRIIRDIREQTPVAQHIKFPSLPAVFSESIVIAATPALFGPGWSCGYGGNECDIILENVNGGLRKHVEVKASGQHSFQELKAKDLRADILIWIRFGRRYQLGSGPIEVAVIQNPGKYISKPRRLDVNRLDRIPGIIESQKILRFESIEQLLGCDDNLPGRTEST
jgi:hypothetical protein